MHEFKLLSPTAILGYGFPEASFQAGLDRNPDVIAVDAGSTDPGPYYLGAGVSFTDRTAVKRDLALMLKAGRARGIPVIVGSAGGSGARPHLDWCRDIVLEVAREQGLAFNLAVIAADVSHATLHSALDAGALVPLPPGKAAHHADIAASTNVVAQIGVEPFISALDAGADVILAGRAYDPAVFAAAPIRAGFDPGLAIHLGKILECAAIAAIPGSGSDCMWGVLRREHFLVEALGTQRACTVTSVAAHSLYEKSNPYELPGPGGLLNLRGSVFSQETARSVRVSGSRFFPGVGVVDGYTVKVEGATRVGYRTVSIAGARDPIFIAQIDEILAGIRARVADNFADVAPTTYTLLFRLYGRDGVMGMREPQRALPSHELGIVIEAVADSQELANTICSFARSTLLHFGYPGRVATAGNLAFPYSPSDFEAGEVFQFSLYHLLKIADPVSLFPIEFTAVGPPL